MQAIQIRYLTATDHRGTRLKAFAGAGSITESREFDISAADQALRLAVRFAAEKYYSAVISGFGQLPKEGDWVATINGDARGIQNVRTN